MDVLFSYWLWGVAVFVITAPFALIIKKGDGSYLEDHPEDRNSKDERKFSTRPLSHQICLGLCYFSMTYGAVAGVYQKYFAPPSAEEIVKQEQRQREAVLAQQMEAEKKRLDELEEKQSFTAGLGRFVVAMDLDFKKLALQHAKETELQNNATEEKLKDKYVRITGKVVDVDSDGDTKYGFQEYMIQVSEGRMFTRLIATARCYELGELDKKQIESLQIDDTVTLIGKVWSYGDVLGLQLNNCTLE
jgi:hypothetical protein